MKEIMEIYSPIKSPDNELNSKNNDLFWTPNNIKTTSEDDSETNIENLF